MEEGSLRCDANVSVKRANETRLGPKVEIKNMNSIRYAQQAVEVEISRQIGLLMRGEVVRSETRGFDAAKGGTYSLRAKEELNDYRYFPEPDISPILVSDEWLKQIRDSMPELPGEAMTRLTQVMGLSEYDARNITAVPELLHYFDEASKYTAAVKPLANWILGPVKAHWNETKTLALTPPRLAELIDLVENRALSFTTASQHVFPALLKATEVNPLQMAQQLNVLRDDNVELLRHTVNEVLAAMPDKVEAYRKGKKGLLSLFVGEIMKRSGGKADPNAVHEWILTTLNKTPKK
jgi:aspartyl-tRNA(Asn)/glutamyl-tRNA(Gln) amidotransferase subunit B